ncbi:MAG TPA: hypothetical protein DCP08_03745 [Chloroflexi bacterium]|nr:hypothetical protein [Chloroflexota bacterium]
MESIETCSDWASRNLERLDFDQKRLMLEALDVQVIVDGKKVMIRGFLPIGSPSFFPASSTPRCRDPREKQPTIAFELAATLG